MTVILLQSAIFNSFFLASCVGDSHSIHEAGYDAYISGYGENLQRAVILRLLTVLGDKMTRVYDCF